MKNKTIAINNINIIGEGIPPYTIAEIGTNHNQSIDIAKELILRAAEAGFSCVKFQTYEVDEIVGEGVTAKDYGLDKYYGDISAAEMFAKYLKTPKEWFPELNKICREIGIDCATTIHGKHGLEWVKNLDFDLIKIASMDHNNFPFLKSLVNSLEMPILISFGMAELEDIDCAIEILSNHQFGVGLFHCVSVYPPKSFELRLSNIPYLAQRYGLPVGFSDHSDDVVTVLSAVALGAKVFEKHITLNRKSSGPDHAFAIEPVEMKEYIRGISSLYTSLKNNEFCILGERERIARTSYLKSIVAISDIPAGSILEPSCLGLLRPGHGIPPKELDSIIGRTTIKKISKGSLINWSSLA
jgi:sialic acid synthase SpsE